MVKHVHTVGVLVAEEVTATLADLQADTLTDWVAY